MTNLFNYFFAVILCLSVSTLARGQYEVDGYQVIDRYSNPKGCYVFAPHDIESLDTVSVVVFLHGYGGLNPMNYGRWLREIIDAGHVVIYPRYQRNLLLPSTKKFAGNVTSGIKLGLAEISVAGWPVDASQLAYIGHSYGGTLSANLLVTGQDRGLPPAYGAVLAAPGTSRFKGARLEDYGEMPSHTQLAIVSHEHDYIVGSELAILIDSTAPAQQARIFVQQTAQACGDEQLGDGHNECYAIDEGFDSGYRNYTTKKAIRVGVVDGNDEDLYWPLTRALLEGFRQNRPTVWPLTDQGTLRYGKWTTGQSRQPIVTHVTRLKRVTVPAEKAVSTSPQDRPGAPIQRPDGL